jgi:hypothetical protein
MREGSEEPRSGVCVAKIKMCSAERDSEADHHFGRPVDKRSLMRCRYEAGSGLSALSFR